MSMTIIVVRILIIPSRSWGWFVPWQVWFRVNNQLPVRSRKSLPDQPPDMQSTEKQEGEGEGSLRVH